MLQTAFHPSRAATWLEGFGYCQCHDEVASAIGDAVCVCDEPGAIYVATIYWTTQIISGLAGGPVERALFSTCVATPP